jgi:hypothetical protein
MAFAASGIALLIAQAYELMVQSRLKILRYKAP